MNSQFSILNYTNGTQKSDEIGGRLYLSGGNCPAVILSGAAAGAAQSKDLAMHGNCDRVSSAF